MLGRNRAGVLEHDLVDGVVDLVPAREKLRGVGADRLADVEMHVAVAEMAERHRPAARYDRLGRHICFPQKFRNRCDRNRDIGLDRSALGLLHLRQGMA